MMFVKEESGKNLDNFFFEYFIRFHAACHVSYFSFLTVSLLFIVANKSKT